MHGVGVIAIYRIAKGERCYVTPNIQPKFYNIPYGSLGKLFPEIKELVLQRWASVVNGSIFQSPNDDAHLLMFMNHSDDYNYDLFTDEAIEDIPANSELFENYRSMENYKLAYPNFEKWSLKKEIE